MINTFAMRVKEWYCWHFPELGRIVTDNIKFAHVTRLIRVKEDFDADRIQELVETVDGDESIAEEIMTARGISMGQDIVEADMVITDFVGFFWMPHFMQTFCVGLNYWFLMHEVLSVFLYLMLSSDGFQFAVSTFISILFYFLFVSDQYRQVRLSSHQVGRTERAFGGISSLEVGVGCAKFTDTCW